MSNLGRYAEITAAAAAAGGVDPWLAGERAAAVRRAVPIALAVGAVFGGVVVSVVRRTVGPMTDTSPESVPTTEVSVETPAKNVETTEVVETDETAGAAEPDAATDAMAVESKEQPRT